jgi:hypothetical protein
MLKLLLAEPHQRFDHLLVAERVIAAQLQDLSVNESLDQTKDVGLCRMPGATDTRVSISEMTAAIAVRLSMSRSLNSPSAQNHSVDAARRPLPLSRRMPGSTFAVGTGFRRCSGIWYERWCVIA